MLTPTESDLQVRVARFSDEGYLVFERLLHGEKLRHYVGVFDELVERAKLMTAQEPHWALELDKHEQPIPGVLHKVQGVCVVEPRILELAKEPEILSRAASLIGPSIDVFGTKFFPKLPGGGTSTHWHQDNFYFGTESDRIVSCAIYFEDTDTENGCLRVVPRSHRGGIAEHVRDTTTHGSWTQVDESKAVDVVCPAGTVVFFSANLLHGAYDNYSNRSRYSTAWHYIPGDLSLERFPRGGYDDRHIVLGQ